MNRLQEKYKNEVVPQLMKDFNYKSVMQVPQIEKVVVNIGVGDAIQNAKLLDEAVEELAAITGQAPVITKAKKSIANFKLREGMSIGCKVISCSTFLCHVFVTSVEFLIRALMVVETIH